MSWVVKGKNGDETLYRQISIQRLPQKQKQRKPTQSEVLQGQEKVLQGQEDTSRVKKKLRRKEKGEKKAQIGQHP